MKVLIIGSGGRECALAWKCAQADKVEKIIVVPGNPGIETLDEKINCISIQISQDEIHSLCLKEKIDLVLIGPEALLAQGLGDQLRSLGLTVLGPSKEAAFLESSKIFSKKMMQELDIPTAEFKVVKDYDSAKKVWDDWSFEKPPVIKIDGLAQGKGVFLPNDSDEATGVFNQLFLNQVFPFNEQEILFEERLTGPEASYFALCDGEHFVTLGHASDYKRVYDDNLGPNTGGMGAFAPSKILDDSQVRFVEDRVVKPILDEMKRKGTPFQGILFVGLLIDSGIPKVLEFNVRFGDPETQALVPLLPDDIVQYFYLAAKGELPRDITRVPLKNGTSIHVVMSSQGYPFAGKKLDTGHKIPGPDWDVSVGPEDGVVFYAGVKRSETGELINSGGRVMGVTVVQDELEKARAKVYQLLPRVAFDNAHFRRDIGVQFEIS